MRSLKEMTSPIHNLIAQAARSAFLAAALLCVSAAILRADEGRPMAATDAAGQLRCRMYFGCLPDIAKEHGHVRQY
jgi:hypothetical protein